MGKPCLVALNRSRRCFRYPSEQRGTLEQISFAIKPGECVAIVGASGSGKSTLARLLAGLYVPAGGSIWFDGVEIGAWDLAQLRARLGFVTQDTRLFSGSVRDNVTVFEPEIADAAVQAACRVACLDADIAQLPMGYDTMLADGGTSLSGGQRQRLSLARALLRRPDILILDEATFALDTVTEQAVHAQLRELRCTRVVIAHRLSTIVDSDRILVLDRGRLLAVGSHTELSRSCPAYQALIRAQHEPRPARPIPAAAGTPTMKLHAMGAEAVKVENASGLRDATLRFGTLKAATLPPAPNNAVLAQPAKDAFSVGQSRKG